jgi:hypothetical protein
MSSLHDLALTGATEPFIYYVNGFMTDEVPPEGHAVLYRAEASDTGWCGVSVTLWAYRVTRYTPCGAWIDRNPFISQSHAEPNLKFVNLRAGKQWASASKDEALYGLMRRRARQVTILLARLRSAERELAYLKEMLK